MIDQLILEIAGKHIIFMLTETRLFICEGVVDSGFFAFNPAERMEITPVSWKSRDLYPLHLHEDELRLMRWLEMQLQNRQEKFMEEAN